jgi:hypothetical protein
MANDQFFPVGKNGSAEIEDFLSQVNISGRVDVTFEEAGKGGTRHETPIQPSWKLDGSVATKKLAEQIFRRIEQHYKDNSDTRYAGARITVRPPPVSAP